MKEYIDRDAARDLMERALEDDWEIQYANDRLRDIPAADVVEVRHGRWIDSEEDGHLSICGVCNYPVDRFYKTKYCPNCGAKMDGGADDDDN